jgi:hypothetical protein
VNADESYQQELRERRVRQKHLDVIVQAATNAVAITVAHTPPRLHHHTFYGASAIHPRHLVIWYVFHTDADFATAQTSGLTTRLDEFTRRELRQRDYPPEAIQEIFVSFTTHETVGREAGGNYWQYFK